MNILIIYDSKTGKTAKAAELMGVTLSEYGHQCQIQSVALANPAHLSEADLIFIGTWVKGLFIILQHPNPEMMQFIDKLDILADKKVAIFCTYILSAGSTLHQMTQALKGKGAEVVAQFKYRGPIPNDEFSSFAKTLTLGET